MNYEFQEEGKLESPEYYLNRNNGDLMIIWYSVNRPTGIEWIKISELCYKNLTD